MSKLTTPKKCRRCGKTYQATHKLQWYCKPCKRIVVNERHARNAEAIFRD